MAITNGGSSNVAEPHAQTDVRLYKNRASYNFHAARSIIAESPVAHVAFVHPGDEATGRDETIMNVPLISVVMRDFARQDELEDLEEEELAEEDYAIYLHTHRQSGVVEAVQKGAKSLTATTTKIDALVLSPTAHDHSLDYRSATFHLHSPQVLNDDDPNHHEEKRACLASVTNTVTGYERTALVGLPNDPNVKRTTVVKCYIKAISCKQRYGAFNGGKEPVQETPEGLEDHAFTGVVPCWTQWGTPLGYGKDRKEVEELFEEKNRANRTFADAVVWASDTASLEGLGKKRFTNKGR